MFPENIYIFEVNNRNTGKRCEIFSKVTINTPEQLHLRDVLSGVFIVNFEHISHLFPVFLLLTLNKCMFAFKNLDLIFPENINLFKANKDVIDLTLFWCLYR